MRPGAGFDATAAAAAAPPVAAAHSAWHSPVPYLFGGLAAMLGLIAFALLILACSYWKLSGYLEAGAGRGEGEEPAAKPAAAAALPPPVWEEKILVIMAGDVKPTYLATPMSSRASSFGSSKEEENKSPEQQQLVAVDMAGIIKDADGNGEHSESQLVRDV